MFRVVDVHVQHWHGIHQHSFNAYDGASFVTQCPIIPGDMFRYQFTVPDQAVRYEHTVALNGCIYIATISGYILVSQPLF